MYHSVTLGDKNTWSDWGLVSATRPFIAPPSPKLNLLDIPGASAKLDFSEGLTGYPTFNNRTGSIDFTITDQYISDQNILWTRKYTEIMTYISGRKLRMILEDDPDFFYEGRFSVDTYSPGTDASSSFSHITISYDVGPYKWTNADSLNDNWLWDPFSFVDGVIVSSVVKNIPVTDEESHIDLAKELIGAAPFCPEFLVNTSAAGAQMSIRVVNPELNIDTTHVVLRGTHMFYDAVFWANVLDNSHTTVYMKMETAGSTGTLSLRYRRGGL